VACWRMKNKPSAQLPTHAASALDTSDESANLLSA
jgi:hypothetical protein